MLRTRLCLALLCSALPAAALSVPALAAPSPAPAGRQVADLSSGWRFHFGDSGEAPAQPGFDDSGWDKVSVPHTWDHIGEYADKRSAAADSRQGVGWYRLNYAAPAAARGQRQYLDFAAVGKVADVWVNGVHVGQHRGAFARFRFDVTAAWKPGAPNLVVVRADNSKPVVGGSTEFVIPLGGDFFVSGGIYRGVTLVTADATGIDLLDHGGSGVYARASDISADKASVSVLTRLRNAGSSARRLTLATTVRDAGGSVVARSEQPQPLKPGAAEATASLTLPHPHLWNGRADPYLYAVTVDVLDHGRVIDSVTQPLGVRSFRFDADAGYFLNGVHLPLHGVARHQDRQGEGWALSAADHAEDMAMIAELGANTVRMAHYQHADEWVSAADRTGMVAWAEVPYVNSPGLTGGAGSPVLWANAEEQLRELIRQDYNHPSVMMWSIGNEVDAGKAFGMKGDAPRPLALLKRLNAVAKQEDPSRPTTFADCCEGAAFAGTGGEPLAGTADLIGYNRYFGWYMPQPLDARAQIGAELDKLHAKHPALPISISEYGAGGAASQHSDNVRAGFLNFMGRPQPEEFQSQIIEANWPALRDRPFVFSSWLWNMFDFPSDLREEGDSVDLNTKGLVTFDRKVKKDAFYYLKAQWNPAPMLWLAGKRHTTRAYPVAEVKAYTNADRAALAVNGRAVGEVPCPERTCVWPAVALAAGDNRVEVTATSGTTVLHDSAVWNAPDPRGGIHIDAGDLATHTVGGQRYGSDNFVTGGTPRALNMGGFGAMRSAPRVVVAEHPELYAYWREGEAFSYAIPLPDGKWTVTIHSFQTSAAAAPATMSVSADDKPALAPFNVMAEAGGALKGLAKSFPVTVKGGSLRLDFAGQGGKAVVAAIDVAPAR
ncbi:MAG: beta-galactosidase [Sphingomonadales bacterium]|nr:beta-galactosidase [Sphingomonadales bacterium]